MDEQDQINKLKETITGLEKTSKMLVRRDIDLRRAYDNLKLLDREKTEFVSIAAHQLRTPVTTARWAMQALSKNLTPSLDPSSTQLLTRASDSVERIFKLTEDMLELNRIDFGNTVINISSNSIEKILEDIIKDHEPALHKKSISIVRNYTQENKAVNLDPVRIRDVFDNLIDNAIKYTSAGGEIRITTNYKNDTASIEITDTGIGVELGLEDKIFNKFTR